MAELWLFSSLRSFVSYYQQLNLFVLTYLSTHSDFTFMTSYIQVLHILKHIFPLHIDGTLQCNLTESEVICGKLLKKSCWTTFHPVISLFQLLTYMLHWVFHHPNMSGSYISFWISTAPWILGSQGSSLKLLERTQLDKPSSLVKSFKFALVNSWLNNECTQWPSSILIFDWLELFCLIHCVSQSLLLDICLNAIHFLSKSLFLTTCDSLIITFAFP